MVKQQSGLAVANSFAFGEFLKNKYLIHNHPYFDSNSTCRLWNEQSCPSDLQEIIGPKLANEIYFLLSQGVISHQILSNIISHSVLEPAPLLDSEEYNNSLSYLMPCRSLTFSIASLVVPPVTASIVIINIYIIHVFISHCKSGIAMKRLKFLKNLLLGQILLDGRFRWMKSKPR